MSTKLPKASFFLVSCILGIIGSDSFAQTESDKEAIKSVITRETSSFFNVDREHWSQTWMQTPYAYWSFADSSAASFLDGWETINKTFDEYFRNQKPSQAQITDEWIEVRVYGNGAFARFIQTLRDGIDTEVTSQMRVLEKQNGKWKVVCVGVTAKYPKR